MLAVTFPRRRNGNATVRSISRRRALGGSLALAAAGLVAACGGSQPSPPRAATSVPTPRGLSGTITVSYPDELGKKPPYVERAAAAVMAAHPGATVRIDLRRVSSGDYYTQLVQRMQQGDVPDVFHVSGERIGELVDAGRVAPLDEFLALWPDWRYYPEAIREGVHYQGKVWAVPYGLDTRFLYYRRDVFARAGLPPDWQPDGPQGILAAAVALRDRVPDVAPYALYAGAIADTGAANHGFIPLVWAYGGEVQDQSGRWVGDSPAIRRALAHYARAFREERLVPPELLAAPRPWTQMRERLGAGTLGILFEGGWVYGNWVNTDRAGTERNVGYLLHPAERGGQPFTVGGLGTCWYLSATSRHKELAWEFMRTWNNADTVARLNVEDPHPAARVDAVKVAEFAGQRYLVDSTSSLERARFLQPDAAISRVFAAMQAATLRAATGELPPEDAAARYGDELRAALGTSRVVTG